MMKTIAAYLAITAVDALALTTGALACPAVESLWPLLPALVVVAAVSPNALLNKPTYKG